MYEKALTFPIHQVGFVHWELQIFLISVCRTALEIKLKVTEVWLVDKPTVLSQIQRQDLLPSCLLPVSRCPRGLGKTVLVVRLIRGS